MEGEWRQAIKSGVGKRDRTVKEGTMGRSLLMAFDLGGGSGRCMLVDPEKGVVGVTRRTWTHPVAPGTANLGFDRIR